MPGMTRGSSVAVPVISALAVAIALGAGLGCVRAQTGSAAAPSFDGVRAFEHVRRLVDIGPRVAGTAGARQARRYIR